MNPFKPDSETLESFKKNPYLTIAITIILLVLVFLVWQVTNHIPSQIQEVKTDLKDDIERVENKIEKVENKIDILLFYLLDSNKESLKEKLLKENSSRTNQ